MTPEFCTSANIGLRPTGTTPSTVSPLTFTSLTWLETPAGLQVVVPALSSHAVITARRKVCGSGEGCGSGVATGRNTSPHPQIKQTTAAQAIAATCENFIPTPDCDWTICLDCKWSATRRASEAHAACCVATVIVEVSTPRDR